MEVRSTSAAVGTNLALVRLMRDFLKAADRSMRVSTDSSMFDGSSP